MDRKGKGGGKGVRRGAARFGDYATDKGGSIGDGLSARGKGHSGKMPASFGGAKAPEIAEPDMAVGKPATKAKGGGNATAKMPARHGAAKDTVARSMGGGLRHKHVPHTPGGGGCPL